MSVTTFLKKPLGMFDRLRAKQVQEEKLAAPAGIATLVDELRLYADAVYGPGWLDANMGAATRDKYQTVCKKIAADLGKTVNGYEATAWIAKLARENALGINLTAHSVEGQAAVKMLAFKAESGGVHPAFAAKVEAAQKKVDFARKFCAELGVDFDEVLASKDPNILRDAMQARAEKELAAETARLEKRAAELRQQIAAKKAENAEYRAVIAKEAAVRAEFAVLKDYCSQFLGVSLEKLHALLEAPDAFKAKLAERIELKATEQLAKHGINCAPVGYHPQKPRLTGLARATEAMRRDGGLDRFGN